MREKTRELIKRNVILFVENNNEEKLAKFLHDKVISKALLSDVENGLDVDFDDVRIEKDGVSYSLVGYAIYNCNPTIYRLLANIGVNPLVPAYEKGEEKLYTLDYLEKRKEELEFEDAILIGELEYFTFHNGFKFGSKKLAKAMQTYAESEKTQEDDNRVYEAALFYNYNLFECPEAFEADGQEYYSAEYLIRNEKEEMLTQIRKMHELDEKKTMIPYHGIDADQLLRDLFRPGYIYPREETGKTLIREDGTYTYEEIMKSFSAEKRYRHAIHMQTKPTKIGRTI